MSKEKESFSPQEPHQSELQLDTEEVYKRVLQICKLEEDMNKYDEHTRNLLRDNFRCVKGLVNGSEENIFIEGFGFLRQPDSEDIEIMLLLSNLSEKDEEGDDLLEILDVFKDFKEKIKKGFRPQKGFRLKVHEADSYQDFFFTFYPEYVQVSDPERVSEIEEMLERMDWRELIIVEEEDE